MAARVLPFVDPADVTDTLFVNVLTNRDFGNAKGVDLKIDWRAGTFLNTSIAYTYQISKNTGSDPFAYLQTFGRQVSGLTGDRTPPPEQAQRTDDDRTHSLSAAVALQLPHDFQSGSTVGTIFRDVGAFMGVRAASGLPFTRLENSGDGQLAPRLAFGLGGRADGNLNAEVMPWTATVDLRVNKGFRLGGMDLAAFVDVRNLLNTSNTIQIFAETGDVENLVNRYQIIGDPNVAGGEYGILWSEANTAGALDGATNTITFGNCQTWAEPVNCEALKRAESRFGDGNGVYTFDEQQNAFNSFYDSFFGTQSGRFYASPRHVRLGFELNF
jgi:hypothetical protein